MEKEYGTPFYNSIVETSHAHEFSRLRELQNSSYYIRTYQLAQDPTLQKEIIAQRRRDVARVKMLASYNGISAPSTHLVLGLDETQKPAIHLLTEKIVGENIQNLTIDEKDSDTKEALENFICGLIEYSQGAFKHRGAYLSDQNLSQYVYGRGRDGMQKVYMVDIGIEHRVLPLSLHEQGENSYFLGNYMRGIFTMLESLEEKVGVTYVRPRIELCNFLGKIPAGTTGISYTRSLFVDAIQGRFPNM